MSQEILRVEHLKKYFDTPRGKLHAVDNVGFTLNAGKTLGVVGESGCGKSTLGRTVLGLTSATDGKIFFQGEDITFAKGHARRELQKKMQIIFQDPFSSLNPRYTVFELIANPIRTFRLCRGKAETERKVFELMDTVGLARRFAYAYPHELDGGRRQRIGIARALSVTRNSSSVTSRYPPWTCLSRPRCSICCRTYRNRKISAISLSPMICRWSSTSPMISW